jgi:hypothetical protein
VVRRKDGHANHADKPASILRDQNFFFSFLSFQTRSEQMRALAGKPSGAG